MTRCTHYFKIDGVLIETDTIVATRAEWAASTYSREGSWSVGRDGRRIVASRCLLPDNLLSRQRESAYEFPAPIAGVKVDREAK